MLLGPEELHTLRRALAQVIQPQPPASSDAVFADRCLRLLADLAEATREAARKAAFTADELRRYRAALPGAAAGYTELLEQALADGHRPLVSDVVALRTLTAQPAGAAETARRRALLRRCERAAAQRYAVTQGVPPVRAATRGRPLIALPGGRMSEETTQKPAAPRAPQQQPHPSPGGEPGRRPVPTPAEVFPPGRRRPPPPPVEPDEALTA
ncbi:hypothetical protein SRB5_48330 [Streptomyces sp. RB5]|uniref:Uncharacterized protein n=2 Tax=Streptomyces smaragdinus TaxID=2585196 RepID=A0A7K0CMF8_9ACTN|nr:hypothetical protein [Streptomyces smaragdinus]